MQSALFRVWTHVAMYISYEDNHYTTSTSSVYVCVGGSFLNDTSTFMGYLMP